METNAYNQKLNRYVLNDQIVYTGFSSFKDAEECAHKKGGTLVEVVFRDGNDNPEITDEAGLIEKKFITMCMQAMSINLSIPQIRDLENMQMSCRK
ncbi:hypothetical protein [Chryseobacterium sp. PCH239]|uniref:hypothetical protein n=1 Tax=Chryseobacterium sp. PCH239 TaxID=2825845 RepID=UPI00209CCFC6|nr:hypothetical protein [Chryseobacterium sp. PCH239]